jgi:N-acetylmuramoyl-L-alanine amidase
LAVPPIEPKSEPGQTEMRHRFVRKGQPAELRLRVLDRGQPLANQPFTLIVDNRERVGTTDAEGKLSCPIPADARRGTLRVGSGERVVEYALNLGHLDPGGSISGAQGRLKNLGFYRGAITGRTNREFEDAVRRFQRRRNLRVTGEIDESTRRAIAEQHGC